MRLFPRLFLLLCISALSTNLWAADTVSIQGLKRVEVDEKKNVKKKGLYMETFYYEDFIYSKAKKTELGDQVELSASLRYQLNDDTFFRGRFETFPEDNRLDNRTGQFELLAGHKYGSVDFTVDLEINTNESSNGGTTLGIDLDSEFSRINWKVSDNLRLAFYPFNFDGEVGVEFNTWDVTRIYSIEGNPTSIQPTPGDGITIVEKTIPGLEMIYGDDRFNFYAGAGIASYLYPSNENFDIQNSVDGLNRWERRTTFGYKFGMNYRSEKARVWIGAVGHTESEETGSLIEQAASAYGIFKFKTGFIFEGEFVTTKAGKAPWRVTRSGTWFEVTTFPAFNRVYSDFNSNIQDWVGKTDYATSLRLGYEYTDTFIPYAAFRYQGAHFLHRDAESAQSLRNFDESLSHGGLTQIATGSFMHYGNFVVNPELEYRRAKNPVFSNLSDVVYESSNSGQITQRQLASFTKSDVILKIFVTYSFDGAKPFTP